MCGVSIVPKNDFYLRLFALTPRRKWLHKKGTRRQGGEERLFCRFVDERERFVKESDFLVPKKL